MSTDSEYRLYAYIAKALADLGWSIKNPAKGGDVYTQGEFRQQDRLLREALGLKTPENIITIPGQDGTLRYWIVEAKAAHKDLKKAIGEAQGYAESINRIKADVACFATGVAGMPDDSFYVSTNYWDGRAWQEVKINDHKTTGFLSREQCNDIIANNSADVGRFDDDRDRFLRKANAINKTLHDNGVAVGDRAKMIGALLLALADDGNLMTDPEPKKMIQTINIKIESILRDHNKEEFAETIKLRLPATSKNHHAYRRAMVETLQHLREMNVRSAINSGDDALGKFYETFLKYANGAKEMGIVLTPRHITKLAVEVLDVNHKDKVFDPTCGTGGFLVSALDHVRKTAKPKEYDLFKSSSLWGVEKEDPVYGLALVNMIFRGDGKSGLQDGNCFDHQFWQRNREPIFYTSGDDKVPEGAYRPFTKVLMNPPYKISGHPETTFIDYALAQCRSGAILFAVLPYLNMEGQRDAAWRSEILKRHSLKAIIKFDKNLFYPVAEGTYGIIIEAHRPHKIDSEVFMGVLFDDQSRPRKSKMLSEHDSRDNVEEMTASLQKFLRGERLTQPDIPQERIITTINQAKGCSYSPEAYISNAPPETMPDPFNRALGLLGARLKASKQTLSCSDTASCLKKFNLMDFVVRKVKPPAGSLKQYPDGNVPVVSATAEQNGISEWKSITDNDKTLSHLISISKTHNTLPCQAFWHPYRFSAIATVHLIQIIPEFTESDEVMLYLCQSITDTNAWRYDYARTVKLHELEVFLPTRADGTIDKESIINEMRIRLKDIPKHSNSTC